MKYPAVDPEFYKVDAEKGMSEEEITEDWHAFIDGLNEFSYEVDSKLEPTPEPASEPKKFSDLAKEIISKLVIEEPHADTQKG